jgi:hypothetical protein
MALPNAVQQKAEEADRLMAELSGEAVPQPVTPQDETPDEPQAQVPTLNEVETAKPVPEETWEQKFHSLKGKFDAEVPRLHADLREMKTQLSQLNTEKAQLENQFIEQQVQRDVPQITEQDKEAFGSDLIDLIDRATSAKLAPLQAEKSKLERQVSELQSQLGNVSERQGMSDKDRWLMGLSQKVSDWEVLNTYSNFLAWLSEVDPVYGVARQAALNSAAEAFDVNRTAAIFQAYKSTLAPQQVTQKPSLKSQVAPTRSRAANTPVSNDVNAKIWSSAEVSQFYDDVIKGRLSSEEIAQMEQEINRAAMEGRISR